MARRSGCLVLVVIGVLFAGGLITWTIRGRALAERLSCNNNLRVLALMGSPFARDEQGMPKPLQREQIDREGRLIRGPADAVWPGTVYNDKLPAEQRLSWVVFALPGISDTRQPTEDLVASIDRSKAWDAENNLLPGRTRLKNLICPANALDKTTNPTEPTHYVGVGGLGVDAATLPLGPPIPPRAGAFRYDLSTPFSAFEDGLSQTFVFGESSALSGPWIRGGVSTIHCFDDSPGAPSQLGREGIFNSLHEGGIHFAFADGSARFFTVRTSPSILFSMATIAGGKATEVD